MEAEAVKKQKPAKLKRKRMPKLLILAGIIIVLGALAAVLTFKFHVFSKAATIVQRTSTVAKGDLTVTVTGSGSVESSNRVDISPSVQGKLTKVYFKEGDSVKSGDLMYEIDDSEARRNVEQIKNSIAQAQLSVDSNAKTLSNLTIDAPFSGQVTNISVKAGDKLEGNNAVILTITNSSQMTAAVPFGAASINKIAVGQKVTVYIQDLMQSVEGVVTSKSSYSYVSDKGSKVCDVDISIDNPGALKEGMVISAEINSGSETISGLSTSKLEYADSKIIKSSAGGTVQSVNVKENQMVTANTTLVTIENDDAAVSAQTAELKLDDLKAQLASAEDTLESYKIYAPSNGIIVSQSAVLGTNVNNQSALATLSDVGNMQFSIDIDELDIDKIKLGQKVNITIDALTDTETTPLTGVVSKIAIEGTSSNGVTTYPVTIKFDDPSKLKVGMNANAEILVNEKTSVLYVPLEAIQTVGNKNFVWVKTSGSTTAQSGFTRGNGAPGSQSGSSSGNTAQNGNTANRNTANGNTAAGKSSGSSAGKAQGSYSQNDNMPAPPDGSSSGNSGYGTSGSSNKGTGSYSSGTRGNWSRTGNTRNSKIGRAHV